MSFQRKEAPIKYESPYSSAHVPLPTPTPERIPLHPPTPEPWKRPRSPDGSPDSAEKRQRIETATAAERRDSMNNLAAIIAKAAATASQQVTPGFSVHPRSAQDAPIVEERVHRLQPYSAPITDDPNYGMRILSLPMLESLSMQILALLAQRSYLETIRIATEQDTELGEMYHTLKSLFDQVKIIYGEHRTFLSAKCSPMYEKAATIFRMANLATFISSVFTWINIGFPELNDHFIDIFARHGEALSKAGGSLYINLKTQIYLAGMSQEEPDKTKEETLEDLFPRHLEGTLAKRHGGSLSAEEVIFLQAARERYEYLMNAPSDAETIQSLSERFSWESFLSELSDHLNSSYGSHVALHLARHSVPQDIFTFRPKEDETRAGNKYDDIAKRAADDALQAVYGIKPQPSGPVAHSGVNSSYSRASVPYPTQSAPTQVLYEQARQAAVAKANPGVSRRPGLPSQRRPWSTDEENALMAGLDQVKGPHWSQILALYGTKGSISEILRDRNQVQLKDKARNLKLFFLKSNIEVPYYLQSVTGELKTRAPSLVARQEAEDRARLMSEDAQAHYNGIVTLARGLEDDGSELQGVNASPEPVSGAGRPDHVSVGVECGPCATPHPELENILGAHMGEGLHSITGVGAT